MRLDSQHIWKSVLVRLRQIDCLLVSFYCSTFYSTSGGNVVHNTCESNCLEDLSSLSCHLCKQDRHNMYEWCLLEFCVQKFGMSFRTLSIIILVLGSKSRFIQQSFPLSKSSDAIDHSFRHCLCSYRCMAFSCHVFPTMYSILIVYVWENLISLCFVCSLTCELFCKKKTPYTLVISWKFSMSVGDSFVRLD